MEYNDYLKNMEILFNLLENNRLKKNSYIKTSRSVFIENNVKVISHVIIFDLTTFSIEKKIDNNNIISYVYYADSRIYFIDDVIKEVKNEINQRDKRLNKLI